MQEISATLSSPSSSCSCVWRHWCPPSALWSCPPSPPPAWMWRWVRAPADPRLRAAAPLGLPGGSSHLSPFVRSHPHRSLVSCPLHPLCSELPLLEHLPELFLSQLLQFVSSQPPPPPACGGSSGLTPPSTLADPQNNLQTVQHRRVNLWFWKLLLLCSGVCVYPPSSSSLELAPPPPGGALASPEWSPLAAAANSPPDQPSRPSPWNVDRTEKLKPSISQQPPFRGGRCLVTSQRTFTHLSGLWCVLETMFSITSSVSLSFSCSWANSKSARWGRGSGKDISEIVCVFRGLMLTLTVVISYLLIFLFMFSERTEANLLTGGLLFPLDVIYKRQGNILKQQRRCCSCVLRVFLP